jgi:hypothetical protein
MINEIRGQHGRANCLQVHHDLVTIERQKRGKCRKRYLKGRAKRECLFINHSNVFY